MQVEKILVLGAGQMGLGIAQVAASSGHMVFLSDVSQDVAEAAKSKLASQLEALVIKGKIDSQKKQDLLQRIQPIASLRAAREVEMVIEAVTEKKEFKFSLFRELDTAIQPEAVLASNTSSISITEIAAQTKRPHKVVGMHFMNPVPLMKLVEGIRGLQTSDETFLKTKEVSEKMGKTFVAVQDVPGFAVNRILMPMINEAIQTIYEGISTPQDVDTAMKLGTNQPMGPLELADFIGLDTCLAIMEVLHEGFSDSKYRPSPLLKKYVQAGWFGKKSGRGFYQYGEQKK